MFEILLAGVVCVLALGVTLLFRQLRKISWQLTQLRVEHDSEQILRAIGMTPTAIRPSPAPTSQKRLIWPIAGGIFAAAASFTRALRAHPVPAGAIAALTVAAAAVVAVVVGQLGSGGRSKPAESPPASPTTTATTAHADSEKRPAGAALVPWAVQPGAAGGSRGATSQASVQRGPSTRSPQPPVSPQRRTDSSVGQTSARS